MSVHLRVAWQLGMNIPHPQTIVWTSEAQHTYELAVCVHPMFDESTFDLRGDGGDFAVTNITRAAARELQEFLDEWLGPLPTREEIATAVSDLKTWVK